MFSKFLGKLCFVTLAFASYSYCSELPNNSHSFDETYLGYFKGKEVKLFLNEEPTGSLGNKEQIGSLSYLKVPVLSWYMLYYFYINPDHRKKGWGKILFKHVLEKVKELGATKVMLQTGPYEYNEKGEAIVSPPGPERDARVEKLLKFYFSFNFKLLNRLYATLLAGVYFVFRVDEDPAIFMTMDPNQKAHAS